jgi:hypothetical protein
MLTDDGDGWTVTLVATDQGAPMGLSCASATECVGLDGHSTFLWDGASWTVAQPDPIGGTSSLVPFGDLSCVPDWCMRVGSNPPSAPIGVPVAPVAAWLQL